MSSQSCWETLPQELRHHILEQFADTSSHRAAAARVCRDWHAILAPRILRSLRITVPRIRGLVDLAPARRHLVRCIWFCVELARYDCNYCSADQRRELFRRDGPFSELFGALKGWPRTGFLLLDISIYSPSNPVHHFPHMRMLPPFLPSPERRGVARPPQDDEAYGSGFGIQVEEPTLLSRFQFFGYDYDTSKAAYQLAPVPAVTGLFIRRQQRTVLAAPVLEALLAALPGLERVYWEPWKDLWQNSQPAIDHFTMESLCTAHSSLRTLVLFENVLEGAFYEHFSLTSMMVTNYDKAYLQQRAHPLSTALRLKSRSLERLAASFVIDASLFFSIPGPEQHAAWDALESLILTSALLHPDTSPEQLNGLLRRAGHAARRMPRLERLQLWNGGAGFAGAFKYARTRRGEYSITWRATWAAPLARRAVRAWEDVVAGQDEWRTLRVRREVLEDVNVRGIRCRVDAAALLELGEVAHPVSLFQMQEEADVVFGTKEFCEALPDGGSDEGSDESSDESSDEGSDEDESEDWNGEGSGGEEGGEGGEEEGTEDEEEQVEREEELEVI